MYLGDYAEDATLDFKWGTQQLGVGSVTRATNGTVSVYKANGTTQSTSGVTDTEDFDSQTGLHHCRIDLSADAFYATGADYSVVVLGMVIDGQTLNVTIAHFSIENRFNAAAEDLANGTDGLGAIKAVVDDILTDTAEIGTAGAGLTNINLPNQTMDIVGNITGNLSGSVGSVTGNVGGIAGTLNTLDDLDTAQDSQHSTTQTAIADLPTNSELATALGTADDAVLAAIAALSIPTSTSIWDDEDVESGISMRQAMRAIASVLAGTVTRSGQQDTFSAIGGGTSRVVSTSTPDGERTAVSLNL